MSPHNTKYKNKAAEVARVGTASKNSANNPSTQMQKAKTNNSKKSSPYSMSVSLSTASSSPSVTSSSNLRSNSSPSAPSGEISKPKRPLSAYNFFFKHARDELLASTSSSSTTAYDHSKHATTLQSPSARRDLSKKGRPPPHRKIGFAEMARQIGAKWKALEGDRREPFDSLAMIDKQRYRREMDMWKAAGGDKLLQNQKDKNAGTASSTGTNTRSAKSAASRTPRKTPPSSPKSKKSRSKKAQIDTSKVVSRSPHQEIYSHEDDLSDTIGAPSSSTHQPSVNVHDNLQGALDRACEIAEGSLRFSGETQHVDCGLPHTASGCNSVNSSASTLYESAGTSAGAIAGTASNNYRKEPYMYGSCDYTGGQQQQPHTHHTDFQPPIGTTCRRVSDMGGSDYETLYSGHYTGQQRDYSDHNQDHNIYNRQHRSTPPPYYPHQQVAPSHRRPEISCDDGRNVSVSSTRPDIRDSKIESLNWNTTMWDYSAAGAPPQQRTGASLRSHHNREPTTCKLPSSSTDDEAYVKSSQEPKWSDFDFDDADRLLGVVDKIDEDDLKFWEFANPMA